MIPKDFARFKIQICSPIDLDVVDQSDDALQAAESNLPKPLAEAVIATFVVRSAVV